MLTSLSEIAGIKHDYCIWNDSVACRHGDPMTRSVWNRLDMADGDNNPEIVISANEIPITYSQRPLCNVYKQIPRGFRVSAAWISAGDGLRRGRGSSRSKNRPFQELPAYLLTPDSICSVQTMSRYLDFHLFRCKTLLERWRLTAFENGLLREFRVFQRERRLELNFLRAFQRMERYLFRILIWNFDISFCFIIVSLLNKLISTKRRE